MAQEKPDTSKTEMPESIRIYRKIDSLTKKINIEKREIRKLRKQEKTTIQIKSKRKKILQLEQQHRELLKKITPEDQNFIITLAYEKLFADNASFREKIKSKLNPESLLLEKLQEADRLEKLIESGDANQEDQDNFFQLLPKLNTLLILIKNLELNTPEQKNTGILKAQIQTITTPIALAESAYKAYQEVRQKFSEVKHNIEEYIAYKGFNVTRKKLISIPSFFSGLNPEIEDKIKTEEKENLHKIYAEIFKIPFEVVESMGLDSTKEENHPKTVLHRIQNGKEEAVDTRKKEDLQKIMKLIDGIHKHELLASLLNMEFSHWRRFALLNLEIFKAIKNKLKPANIRAIIFDEIITAPGIIDIESIGESDDDAINLLNQKLIQSIETTFMYEKHTWSVGEGPVGELLNQEGVTNVFTTFNRCSREHDGIQMSIPAGEFAIIKPSKKDGEAFDVKLNKYSLGESSGFKFYHERMLELWINNNGDKKATKKQWNKEFSTLESAHPSSYPSEFISFIIQFARTNIDIERRYQYVDNKKFKKNSIFTDPKYVKYISKLKTQGIDVKKRYIGDLINHISEHSEHNKLYTNQTILDWWDKYATRSSKTPKFDKILSDVDTLACVFLIDEIHNDSTTINELQEKAVQKTNNIRANFSGASQLFVAMVNKKGDVVIASNHNHSEWDGSQAKAMDETIMEHMLDETQDYHFDEQNSDVFTNINKITSNRPEEKTTEEESNHHFQTYVESEGLLRISDDIATLARQLSEEDEGKLDPDSKLKNPAVIMQLILIHHYREILMEEINTDDKTVFLEEDKIGMLIANSDITKDLDLAPISKGFNLKLFTSLNLEQKKAYLINQSLLLDISLENTTMSLIKKVVEYIPNQFIQEKLNSISKLKPLLDGLRKLSGTFILSHFGLPRIINGEIQRKISSKYNTIKTSFSAHATMQDGSLTFSTAGFKQNSDDSYTPIMSVSCKNRVDYDALKTLTLFRRVIKNYNTLYKNDWIED